MLDFGDRVDLRVPLYALEFGDDGIYILSMIEI